MRPRLWRVALLTGLLNIVAALSCAGSSDPTAPTGISCADCTLVSVDRIIDGDTLDSTQGRVRLYGVNAPEWGDQCFKEATTRLKELAGDRVRLEPGPRKEDSFNRKLAYVYTASGASIDQALLREGLASAWTEDGQHRDALMEVEQEARQQRIGCLW
jgi:micrococcal nuclease